MCHKTCRRRIRKRRYTQKAGSIYNTLRNIKELIQKPNSKYMWKSNNNYEAAKRNIEAININFINPADFDEAKYATMLKEMQNLQWNYLSNDQKKELRALMTYEKIPFRNVVVNNDTMDIENRIRTILERQEPLENEFIVWRGHFGGPKEILPISWFSTSTKERIAKSYKSKEKCCLFKIHLQPGVKILDLYKVYQTYNVRNPYNEQHRFRSLFQNRNFWILMNYINYGEIIVEEGGTFYKDKDRVEKGFKEIENDVFETYYFPKEQGYTYREGKWNNNIFLK